MTLNGYKTPSWDDENYLEIDNGDGYMTLWMRLMLLNCLLEVVKMVNMYIFILYKCIDFNIIYITYKPFYYIKCISILFVYTLLCKCKYILYKLHTYITVTYVYVIYI